MNEMKVIIVEDEERNRDMLQKMVELYCPEVSLAGTADSVASAVTLINETRPDIILMDIELHPGTCFEIFPQLDKLDFEVIFTTAYKDYAIEAIKHGALDYLLKPVNKNELRMAINKALKERGAKAPKQENEPLQKLIRGFKSNVSSRISLHTTDGIIYAEVDEIMRCEAKGAYTSIHFKDGSKQVTSKTLKEYENSLKGNNFFRVHNSHLVNLSEVKKYVKTDGGYLEMKDGAQIPVSNSHKEEFLDVMRQFSVNPGH